MYEWIDEIKDVIFNLHTELNDNKTRVKVKKKVISILENYNINAFVDCSSSVNIPEVVNHGGFNLLVKTDNIEILFKYTTQGE